MTNSNKRKSEQLEINFGTAMGRLRKSIMFSLGGGNHFIEVDEDEDGNHYLVVHSGSRNLGKGNSEWLSSAPHGAGRLMSRGEARKTLSVEDFQNTMSGIYSSTVCAETIDEAPMAYKPASEIMECIKDTVDIVNVIKPIYNFKAKQ